MNDQDQDQDHDHGLAQDLQRLTRRRWGLGLASGLAAAAWAGWPSATAAAGPQTCPVTPDATAGPFPANGQGWGRGSSINALALAGVVRNDIRPGLAGATAVAGGVPMTLALELVNTAGGCAPLQGLAVYVWQCDREGRYSMYSDGVREQNYLRGVQATDAQGQLSFTTVLPGCYAGRVPHIHFEIYRNVDSAAASKQRIKTSQLALPLEFCDQAYAQSPGYADSRRNLSRVNFANDGVFGDGIELQMARISGTLAQGLTASMRVSVKA